MNTLFSWKRIIKIAILRSGALRICASFRPPSAAVLCYHSVADDPESQSDYISTSITVSADLFEKQMRILRERYNPVTLDDIADWLKGNKSLPRRSVAVTFDDGFEDNYTACAPLMEKYNIFGAFYLTVGAVQKNELPWFCRLIYLFQEARRRNTILDDETMKRTWNLGNPAENSEAFALYVHPCAAKTGNEMKQYVEDLEAWFGYKLDLTQGPRMMSFAQADELRRRGHIIGNHTFSHGNAARIPAETLQQEIAEANAVLDREIKTGRSEHFSYPNPCLLNPQWNEQSLAVTKQAGFKTAVLTDAGVVTKTSDPLLLPRVTAGNEDADAFQWRLDNAFAGRMV